MRDINAAHQNVTDISNAEYIAFGFDRYEFTEKMLSQGYSISQEEVHEFLDNTRVEVRLTFYVDSETFAILSETVFNDPKYYPDITFSHGQGRRQLQAVPFKVEVTLTKTLLGITEKTTPSFEETLNYMIAKNGIEERPSYIEEVPPPDLRPRPELLDLMVFTNSTLKLTFSEPISIMSNFYADADVQLIEINKEFNYNIFELSILSGFDNSEWFANSEKQKSELLSVDES